VTPETLTFDVPSRGKAHRHVTVTIPKGWVAPGPRFAIAADVVRNGKYLGQITEAVVDMRV
jgi:hypothetical protein